MRLPTLYNTLEELTLDMNILGKILQVPSQSLDELAETLKEEMKIKNPLPTLEKRRYKISEGVSEDYLITNEEELVLGENEKCVNITLENQEVQETEPVIDVKPEYKAYFKYENKATPSMLEEFLNGDLTRFSGNLSQLGTTQIKKELELTDTQIDELSTTKDTWGSDGLSIDDTVEEQYSVDEEETEFTLEPEKFGTEDEEITIQDDAEYEPQYDTEDEEEVEFTSSCEEEEEVDSDGIETVNFIENVSLEDLILQEQQVGGIESDYEIADFTENRVLTDLDTYFPDSFNKSNEFDTDAVDFIEDYTLDDLDSVLDLEDTSEEYEDNEEDEEEFDDLSDEFDEYDEEESNDLVGGFDETEDVSESEPELEETISDDEISDDVFDDDFEDSTEQEIDLGMETVETIEEHQGGTTTTEVVDDMDLGFIDKSEPEDLDFGSATLQSSTEEDNYINKILNDSKIPEKYKKDIIRDYLAEKNKDTINVDLGSETVSQDTKTTEKKQETEQEVYKDIRHFVREHPRCTVQEILKHFSKQQLERDIMIGKVIRKGKILHI